MRIQQLPESGVEMIRAKTVTILKGMSNNMPKNLTSDEQKAIKTLQNNKNLVITEADKGNCTVVMNAADYDRKIEELLQDEGTYKCSNTDPTKRTEKLVNEFVKKAKRRRAHDPG